MVFIEKTQNYMRNIVLFLRPSVSGIWRIKNKTIFPRRAEDKAVQIHCKRNKSLYCIETQYVSSTDLRNTLLAFFLRKNLSKKFLLFKNLFSKACFFPSSAIRILHQQQGDMITMAHGLRDSPCGFSTTD